MVQNLENMMNPMSMDIQSCPIPTQDPSIRAANTDQAVQLANYGASMGQPACGKCIFFDVSKRMKNCIDEKDSAVGYCHRWQFQCNKENTCDAWDEGGPIRSEKRSLQMQSERQEDAMREGPHVPKEEIMSSITPVQEEQLPAEDMGAEQYVAAARKGGQVGSMIKKKRLGGTKKANRGTGITYDEAWASNKDDVQSKYETQADYEAAAEEWWASQENNNPENSQNPENNEDPNADKKEPVKCIKCVDGAIQSVLPVQGTFESSGICPEGSFDASVVPDPCNMEKDKKDDEKKETEDVDIKSKQQGKPAWMSPDPYHLPFMDDTNLGKAIGAIHGTLYDFGLVGKDKTEEKQNVQEANKLEEKVEDDGRVSCQKCEGGYPISNLFKGACPEGWVPASDTNPCDAGTDPDAEKKESNEDSTEESSFDEAFADARAKGLKEFTWNGKRYHTKTKEEVDAENAINEDPVNEVPAWGEEGSPIGPRKEDDSFKYGGLYNFIKKATQGTEQKDVEDWYQGYLHNIGQEEPMSFEQWKQDKLPFIDTSQVSNTNVTPQDNSQADLQFDQGTYDPDIYTFNQDALDEQVMTDPMTEYYNPEADATQPPAPTEILSCQFCDNGSPRSVPPVDGKCPEGTSPEDGTDPCVKEQDPNAQVEDKKEEGEDKSKRGPCPPTYEWDEEAKTCKPGRNFMRPFTKVPKIAASIKRSISDKKNEQKRQSVVTKSDVVFADVTGEDYQGDTNINTGKKVGNNVYSRQGAYGTEINKFIPTKGGQATIDMETYKKLIKAGAKLDIID